LIESLDRRAWPLLYQGHDDQEIGPRQRRPDGMSKGLVERPTPAPATLDFRVLCRYRWRMPLSAEDITRAFTALSDELASKRERAELLVVGGAALVLLYRARETTKDVDAYFLRPEASIVRHAANAVAGQLDLPADWLNDGAKAYLVQLSTGETLYESSALTVRAASTAQLLAMKLAAWRDAIDRSDARLLLSKLDGSREKIWSAAEPFVPSVARDKARYAFDDLWESVHGDQ
jgi:hypothetical protein